VTDLVNISFIFSIQ